MSQSLLSFWFGVLPVRQSLLSLWFGSLPVSQWGRQAWSGGLRWRLASSMGVGCALVGMALLVTSRTARADDDALKRYRESWNPFSAGPELVSSADLHPQGQFFIRPYLYSELGYGQFSAWSFKSSTLPQGLSALNPQLEVDYGIFDSLELDVYVSEVSWWQAAGDGQRSSQGNGVGDTTAFLKWRFLVQDPRSWEPSLTFASFVVLPSSDWLGTPSVPGGFAPLGRLPATHFGSPDLTEAILLRKNLNPFRISGGVYYSYGLPTSRSGAPASYGDIFQYRLAFEHFLDDSRGLAYAVELLGLHGLPWRADGKAITAGHSSFGLLGVQPTIEYKFTDHIVGAAGALFTIAGAQDLAAIYPNLSVYYYWGAHGGKVVPR